MKFDFVVDNGKTADRDGVERIHFEVDPDDLYPTTLTEIQAVIALGGEVKEHLRMLYRAARRLPDRAWELAQMPYADALEQLTDEERQLRADTLELTRKWFTAELHRSIDNEAMALRILKGDERWRL